MSRIERIRRPRAVLVALAAAGCVVCAVETSEGQIDRLRQERIAVHIDSGEVAAPLGGQRQAQNEPRVVFSKVVSAPTGSAWMRVHFSEVLLAGSLEEGNASFIRITSAHDGAAQRLDEISVEQWRYSSAFFNGERVIVELLAYPGTDSNRIVIDQVTAGVYEQEGGVASICDGVDLRELSDDSRAARTIRDDGGNWLARCTVFLFDHRPQCFLTAGHCITASMIMVEFNVPMSLPDGTPVFSHPDDQYPVDNSSIQSQNSGIGQDWAVFGVFKNSNTGLAPLVAQGGSYTTAEAAHPPGGDDSIVRTGYGITTTTSLPNTWNRVQKTSEGAYVGLAGTTVSHRADTTSGDSGSPIMDGDTLLVIGIHSHGGCTQGGGANHGTAIQHNGLQSAMANPQGVCQLTCEPADLNCDGVVDGADLGKLLSAWGPCDNCDACLADLNGDCQVDGADLGILLANWG